MPAGVVGIAASIIGFVRQAAIGRRRASTIRPAAREPRLGAASTPVAVTNRRYARIDRVFDGELDEVLGELRERLWDSAG